jgi:diaminohydroxyphosphoribosylaminopyrimidine deaminase/5-amino-6-(5-phosphoribosylamino)uracil reductase
MRRALALARRGRFTTAPNPRVGAVVLDARGEVVGEGWHRRAGEPHAEIHALAAAGAAARGGTLVVTLEPCAHTGRTPPCADAVVAAGVARVVAAHRDPDSRTSGRGLARLRAAGIEVEVGAGAEEAIALNLPFLVSTLLGRPTVTLKWAASLDGRIATRSGASQWITGERARRAALELREEHAAIVVGSGTLLADDPRLTRRLGRAEGPILRVVVDRRGRIGAGARLFGEPGPVLVYTAAGTRGQLAELERAGVEVVRQERIEVDSVLADLHRRGVQSVLVEGGGELAGAFHDAGLWDRVVAFVAPLLIGGAAASGALGGSGVAELGRAGRLTQMRTRRLGEDFCIEGIRSECLRELFSSVAA